MTNAHATCAVQGLACRVRWKLHVELAKNRQAKAPNDKAKCIASPNLSKIQAPSRDDGGEQWTIENIGISNIKAAGWSEPLHASFRLSSVDGQRRR